MSEITNNNKNDNTLERARERVRKREGKKFAVKLFRANFLHTCSFGCWKLDLDICSINPYIYYVILFINNFSHLKDKGRTFYIERKLGRVERLNIYYHYLSFHNITQSSTEQNTMAVLTQPLLRIREDLYTLNDHAFFSPFVWITRWEISWKTVPKGVPKPYPLQSSEGSILSMRCNNTYHLRCSQSPTVPFFLPHFLSFLFHTRVALPFIFPS